jgi:FkbM family methyltransferase
MLPPSVHAMMQRLGFDIVPYDADHFTELRRPQMLRTHRIDLVLDVGANDGQYGEALRRGGYEGRIVSFEPLASAYLELERRAEAVSEWEVRQIALGDKTGTASFHVAGNSASSSLLPMTARHSTTAPESAYVAEEQVDVRRLDDIAAEVIRQGERPWLKIDVQGFELAVMQGAERTLELIEVIETELSLVELYEGQGLLGDVFAHLTSRGFGVLSFEPVLHDPVTGELLQMDGVFARSRARDATADLGRS